ncbi:cardiac-enriched FHL2-interacting protein [Pyxicephalus adspersus]|uniref:DUF4585 domain-containing protein n=1 Tax=Pyxicephalus adspersus TaxID=30357 RepID=A0AAV2ZME3_PYXAD|nr:TPA: hypothetical protein GDO54_004676 [Pyxicephalus adspersus]
MLRYKKHRRHADGLAGSSVGVMDDTDREVSSFTDRAFRSLCVAEEEPLNDVPHIPSPINGMPLSTKYHLGIFNLSVRKTQPLAQLPTISRQRAKWAPTFQPVLNCAKDGMIVPKNNINKLCAPKPTEYIPCSKVSSLIRSFDNIENERQEPDEFSLSKTVQRATKNMEEICQKVEHSNVNNEDLESINPEDINKSPKLHRRTAREVFLESQAEICSRLSVSPCSLGSPLPNPSKKLLNQKESLKRMAFLHSENSAFRSWNDINRRHTGCADSDSSVPGTPPILRTATPCSPLLQRTTPGVRARDAGHEVGWTSPASTLSNSFDTVQMLRTVPPLPNKRMTKQSRESSHRVPKVYADNKIQLEDMQVDLGYQSPKEQLKILAKSKSPKKYKQASNTNQEKETVSEISHNLPKQNENVKKKLDPLKEVRELEAPAKEDDIKPPTMPILPTGRIKTIIQQIEKESVKDVVPNHLSEKSFNLKDSNEASLECLSSTLQEKLHESDLYLNSNTHAPPWRRMQVHKTVQEDTLVKKSIKELPTEQDNMTAMEECFFEEKPSGSSFNITNLLTPLIIRKNIHEALEEQPMALTPLPADTITPNDQDQSEISLYRKRNEYKSKATSLLFNLKDMRKRVKSTYNPSSNVRSGYENNQITDSRIQEVLTNGIPLMETSKQVLEIENVSNTEQKSVPRLTKDIEDKQDYLGNTSDNYLCLSYPSQPISCKVFENAESTTEYVNTDVNIQEKCITSHLSPTEHNLGQNVDYPILNPYPKEDTSLQVEQKQGTHIEQIWKQKRDTFPLQEENIEPESKREEPSDMLPLTRNYVLETDVKNAQKDTLQSVFPERVYQCSEEDDTSGKQKIKNDSLKDDLQYYAVSNDNIVKGKVQHEILKEKNDEKVDKKEPLVSEKQGKESTNTEEIKRPSSIIQFKPNLFNIKDNKIKSSSVTKSVRPLLRSLSEDCLIFHKTVDYSFPIGKEDFRVTRDSTWKNRYAEIDLGNTGNMAEYKEEKTVAMQPKLESSDHNNIQYRQLKKHEEREIQELWEKPACTSPNWSKNKGETAGLVNKSSNKKLLMLDEPFFHPVETCVSEVTGLSPECNTLLGHHGSDAINNLVNGENASSPLLDSANTIFSPLDNGLLQFEDAISFSEDIACSTITSPMSESIICSMVASPMSVNTQSSGFTTALSALDGIPSPPLTYVNPISGKPNIFNHDVMNIVPTPAGNSETKISECFKQPQEKSPCVNSPKKTHAAKPPTVPPKSEKALRRAKRLTKKRRKSDLPLKTYEEDFQESDFVLDVPAPTNITPSLDNPQPNFKVGSGILRTLQPDESVSENSTSSLPITQRKLLQDPESGQYFVVDIPVHFRIKTFFDPETGKYLQMSLPPSQRSTPTQEMSNSPFMLYEGLAPVPVTSIASLKRAPQMVNHDGLYIGEKSGSWHEAEDGCLKLQQSIDCDSCNQNMTPTPQIIDRNSSRTRSSDIISIGDIDDFAIEATL